MFGRFCLNDFLYNPPSVLSAGRVIEFKVENELAYVDANVKASVTNERILSFDPNVFGCSRFW
jgi:hypothetical protein